MMATKMPLIHAPDVKLANLRLQLFQVNSRRDFLTAAILLEDQRQHRQQRKRMMWVKPWLSRRVTLGHYDTLMQELMHESCGDFSPICTWHLSKFLLSGDDSPTCQSCGIPLTVKHILVECANLRDIREKYFTVSSLCLLYTSPSPRDS